jgi:hypothetical protein
MNGGICQLDPTLILTLISPLVLSSLTPIRSDGSTARIYPNMLEGNGNEGELSSAFTPRTPFRLSFRLLYKFVDIDAVRAEILVDTRF